MPIEDIVGTNGVRGYGDAHRSTDDDSTYAGIVLALMTAVAVVATAVLFRDLLLLTVGAFGTLLVLP